MDWNNIVQSALSTFRNLFYIPTVPFSRKRRATETNDEFPYRIGKARRLNSGMIRDFIDLEDEPLSDADRGRRLISNAKSQVIDIDDDHPTSATVKRNTPFKTPLRPVETIVLNDDDDIITIKKGNEMRFQRLSSRPTKYTSTPAVNGSKRPYQNGTSDEDDVILVKEVKPTRKTMQDKYNFPSFKAFRGSSFLNSIQNGTKPKEYPPLSCNILKRRSIKSGKPLSAINQSVRLEDRENYKKLLESLSFPNDESVYSTPIGKVFEYDNLSNSRGQKILNMSLKSPLNSRMSPKDTTKMSTKETIQKVLNDFENDIVVIKDSDSESDLIILNPPSPKPDVKVDPVNSLKKIVDTSESSKKDWIDEIVENYKKQINVRQREIDDLREVSKKHEQINKELRLEILADRVNKALQIRDAVLPEEEEEEEPELPLLTKEHRRLIERAFTRSDPTEVLARKFNLNITRKDLMTLSDLHWLNDEVINFYMNLIIERGKSGRWPKSYAFNTFFYTKLTKDGPQSLRRWTKRVDLFEYDLICVPIHLGMHWCMAIIDFRDCSIKYYDSMGGNNNKCLDALRNYLEAEHMDKKKTPYDTSDFILENVKDIPQQLNGSDCGMFSCTFAEFATRNAKFNFSQEHMPYLRHKMVVEIMLGELLMQ